MILAVFAVSGLDAYQVAFSLKTAGLQSADLRSHIAASSESDRSVSELKSAA